MADQRKYNFSAGPSQLPLEVLKKVQEDLLNWQGCGSSVMELSHRGAEFTKIAKEAHDDLKEVLKVSDDYEILFLQGGASAQFANIALNFLDKSADYVNTGQWSKKAIAEAKRIGEVNVISDSQENNYSSIESVENWKTDSNASYLHYTSNETIGGVQFKDVPNVSTPLVCDMSSDILSKRIDISKYAMIYAGAQKNIGPAGLTIAIVRKDFIAKGKEDLPAFYKYSTHAEAGSMYNTPPCFSWYVAGLVFKWLKNIGLENMEKQNTEKSEKLYGFIDQSDFYSNPVDPKYRSQMNIPFILANSELDSKFLEESKEAGLINLKGHRSVGGMRASIYNAMPIEGVNALVDFMKEFENNN